jgi:hypothetical protein
MSRMATDQPESQISLETNDSETVMRCVGDGVGEQDQSVRRRRPLHIFATISFASSHQYEGLGFEQAAWSDPSCDRSRS